ncbi:esterase [Rhizorhabdus wittichii]|uniref:Esterase n=1 Tax=Rhizorhabdus wittichii TaxID=160791 RepID=A0A975D451_9SPHN|nr:hypothetical protein [Rhizorhabdus wittichii]QTH21340.1 esterase [Rhizorhabdus wittichii]
MEGTERQSRRLPWRRAGIGLAILACSHAAAAGEGGLPAIAAIGHFYVAGREVSHGAPGAPIETGQVYVHYVRLARPRQPVPLLLIPGGSLSGAAYETTPDGRPGWQSDFLAEGYSVLVADSGQTGRTPPAPPAAGDAPPAIRDKAFLWETFRIGPPGSWRADPAARRPYPAGRFPVAGFDAFARQVFPRYRPPLDEEVARTAALYDRACPCVVVAHSAAGPIAERAALLRPDRVAALVLVEPSGGIGLSPDQAARLRAIPHLYLWGDHVDQDAGWRDQYAGAARDFAMLRSAGGASSSAWIDLPRQGVAGNSHMLMMDDNSRAVARRIARWIARRGIDRPR